MFSFEITTLSFHLQQLKNPDLVGPFDAIVTYADPDAVTFFTNRDFTDDVVLNSKYRYPHVSGTLSQDISIFAINIFVIDRIAVTIYEPVSGQRHDLSGPGVSDVTVASVFVHYLRWHILRHYLRRHILSTSSDLLTPPPPDKSCISKSPTLPFLSASILE